MHNEEKSDQIVCLVFLLMSLAVVVLLTTCLRQRDQIRVYQQKLIALPLDARNQEGFKIPYTWKRIK